MKFYDPDEAERKAKAEVKVYSDRVLEPIVKAVIKQRSEEVETLSNIHKLITGEYPQDEQKEESSMKQLLENGAAFEAQTKALSDMVGAIANE